MSFLFTLLSIFFVTFTDKQGCAPIAFTDRALEQRTKWAIPTDSLDYAVSTTYTDSVRALGGKVMHVSRWMNGATVECEDSIANKIAACSFVKAIEQTRNETDSRRYLYRKQDFLHSSEADMARGTDAQLALYNLRPLLAAGHKGNGIVLTVIDGGFHNYPVGEHSGNSLSNTFDTAHWLGSFDFTDDADEFYGATGYHGTMCLGLISARTGHYVGAATQADYYLMRSEEDGKESPKEIDNLVAALEKAVTTMPRQAVIDTILQSGLRGRGGGGFPTGRKWSLVAATDNTEKYVICNGDEGDPGAFMDRILLESYLLRVIEGMIIAGYAVGARKGIFYIRAEYPQAVIRTRKAIELCREKGLLGEKLFGSDFSFDVTIFEGAGAFVCGEETALIASIEGQRGFPRQRPPYPAVEGLFGCPTLINNVETLSQISYIIRHGAEAYRTIGSEKSPGTKVFALAGKVCHGGLIEVPMGTTLNQIIEDIGGGVEGGEKLKAVQTGGPSGGCIPAELCDAPVDFDALTRMGAIMGSGGMVVLSESSCMVDVARYFLSFTCQESCGKCTFCRVGIRRMLDILDRLCTGKGTMEDIDKLEELAISIKQMALCGLGKTAPNPVLSTLKYFRKEYEEHVQGICRTGTCKEMVKLEVTEACVGCTKCAKACPSDAIPYTPYERHHINMEQCVLCGLCIDECSYDAIRKVALKS